jgi:hypothetical protein
MSPDSEQLHLSALLAKVALDHFWREGRLASVSLTRPQRHDPPNQCAAVWREACATTSVFDCRFHKLWLAIALTLTPRSEILYRNGNRYRNRT